MNDEVKEITHRNVLRLVDAHKAERERIDNMQRRIEQLEVQVRSLTIRLQKSEQRANEAYAIAQQGRV